MILFMNFLACGVRSALTTDWPCGPKMLMSESADQVPCSRELKIVHLLLLSFGVFACHVILTFKKMSVSSFEIPVLFGAL